MGKILKQLQKRVDGAYDLRDVDDCHAVIQRLLRDLSLSRENEKELRRSLRTLALMVINSSIEAKNKAHEILATPKKDKVGVVQSLYRMATQIRVAQRMSDKKLYDEVLNKVWSNLDASSMEAAVLGEMMSRFKGRLRVSTNGSKKGSVKEDRR